MDLASTNAKVKGKPRGKSFEKDNPGGPGNPYSESVWALRNAILKALSPERMYEIACAIAEKAAKGDVGAFMALADRAMGKPQSAPEDKPAAAPESTMDDVRYVTILLRHQVPPERWLPGIRERYQQGIIKVESTEVAK